MLRKSKYTPCTVTQTVKWRVKIHENNSNYKSIFIKSIRLFYVWTWNFCMPQIWIFSVYYKHRVQTRRKFNTKSTRKEKTLYCRVDKLGIANDRKAGDSYIATV